jgi:excisionase family DNA binding protein
MAAEELKPRSAALRDALEKARQGGKPLTTMLSMREAGEQLGISKWTLYRLIRENKLTTVKIGRRRLVSLKAIERFIRELEAEETG